MKDVNMDILINEYYNLEQTLELEQSIISKKQSHNGYSVEREYINSKEYHDKFEKLAVNKDVQQSIYIQTGRLLEHVDGHGEEKMVAIDARTGKFIVDNFAREGRIESTSFTNDEYLLIQKSKNSVVLIHNHSENGRPSAQDLLTYLNDLHIRLSIVACHDGTLYEIRDVKNIFKEVYEDTLERTKKDVSNLKEAKRIAMTKIYIYNDKLPEKQKLFDIRRL